MEVTNLQLYSISTLTSIHPVFLQIDLMQAMENSWTLINSIDTFNNNKIIQRWISARDYGFVSNSLGSDGYIESYCKSCNKTAKLCEILLLKIIIIPTNVNYF